MKTLILFLLSGLPLFAQITATTAPVAQMPNAFKLCNESDTIISMPVGTVFQFGQDEVYYGLTDTFLPPETSTATYPKLPFFVYYTDWAANPTPETKSIFVQQTSQPQTFTVQLAGQSTPTQIVVPALAVTTPPPTQTPPAVTTNSCSTNNTPCVQGTNSDAAFIVSTVGQVSLSPQETATLKSALYALEAAKVAWQAADTALQSVQKTIATNHSLPANGPYSITTDFSTQLTQVPPVATLSTQ